MDFEKEQLKPLNAALLIGPKDIKKVPQYVYWIVLLSCVSMNISNYYTFDIPQALAIPLSNSTGIKQDDILMLYTVYSVPNCV